MEGNRTDRFECVILRKRSSRLALAAALAGIPAWAQDCEPSLSRSFFQAGVQGNFINALEVWDPDVNGPLGERVIAAGSFSIATIAGSNYAMWNPQSRAWEAIPGQRGNGTVYCARVLANNDVLFGLRNQLVRWNGAALALEPVSTNGIILDIAELPDGDALLAGAFTQFNAQPVERLVRWNGADGQPFATGIDSTINVVRVLQDASVVIGGAFSTVAGVNVSRIAHWNGQGWSDLAGGVARANGSPSVRSILELPNGDLVVSGEFDTAGGVPATNVARWDGEQWHPMGTLENGYFVNMRLLDGVIYGVGNEKRAEFTSNWDYPPMAWDGAEWRFLGRQVFGQSYEDIVRLSDGTILAGGYASGEVESDWRGIASWNGERWYGVGDGIGGGPEGVSVRALVALPGGRYIAGGTFPSAGGVEAANIALWNATGWVEMGSALNDTVRGLDLAPNGDVYATGDFLQQSGVVSQRIGRWDGQQWHPLGDGLFGGRGETIRVARSGDVYVGGLFRTADDETVNGIARWDGQAWNALDDGVDRNVFAICELDNDDLIVGGDFATAGGTQANAIARWDGQSWHPLGAGFGSTSGSPALVREIVQLPNGDVVVAGDFDTADGQPALNIARWNGSGWHAMGTGLNPGTQDLALRVLSNGDLIAAGDFFTVGPQAQRAGIVRWTGTDWELLAHEILGTPMDVIELDDGGVLVGGAFEGAYDFDGTTEVQTHHIARYAFPNCCTGDWDGSGGSPDENDFLAFLADFIAGDPQADLAPPANGSTPAGDGVLNSSDFLTFLSAYAAGC